MSTLAPNPHGKRYGRAVKNVDREARLITLDWGLDY